MNQEAKAASPKNGQNSHHDAKCNTPSTLGKELRMLTLFAAGYSLNRFQAEHHGDHCLPTTVSDLQKRYWIEFQRKQENVPTRFGRTTRVSRYWLEGDHLEKARAIIRREISGVRQANTQKPLSDAL